MRVNNLNKEHNIFLCSLIYSTIIFCIPWDKIRSLEFRDREVYLDYAYYGDNLLSYANFDGVLSYFSKEWFWHFLLSSIKFEPIFLFNLITIFSIFLMSFFLIKKLGYLSPFLLFNPLIIDMVFSQYRISLAFIFLLIALFFKSKKIISLFFLILAGLTHTSSILIISIFSISWVLYNNSLKNQYNIFIICIFGSLLSVLLNGYLLEVLSFIGDRRADYNIDRVSSSFSYLSFWIFNFLFLIFNSINFKLRNFNQYVSLFVLSLVTMSALVGGYSSRFLSVFFIFIWVANLSTPINYRFFILNIYILYLIIQWYYWLGFN